MKDAGKNEVDILLRAFTRRAAGTAFQPALRLDEEAHTEHLDVDELNAFAEGMLPERARVRYSEHLADCANCRGVVIKLTQAAGVRTRAQVNETPSGVTFWEKITAVWSPRVLRFALPAIVLVSIIGIGLLALRPDEPSEFVAQHQPNAQAPGLDQGNQAAPLQSPSNPIALRDQPPTVSEDKSGRVDGLRGASGPTAPGAVAPPVSKSSRGEVDAQPSEATPTFAPDLNTPAAPPPLPAYDARDRVGTLAKEDSAKREAGRSQTEEYKVQRSDSDDRNLAAAAPKAAAAPAAGSSRGGVVGQRRANSVKDKNSAVEPESRSVSGKRFVRRNNAWIDTGYDSSRATTSVKRGSEQYRALVADEPGIRTFAEQLSGEVIVVWNGRAYRIH